MDNENLMGRGGSYTIDPETHDLVCQERTKQPGEDEAGVIEVAVDPVVEESAQVSDASEEAGTTSKKKDK